MKRQPIRVNDQFKSKSGTIWQVFEVGLFGNPHWVINVPERTRMTIFHRHMLEGMTRVEPALAAPVGEEGAMLSDETPEVYLKRRRLARDYFLHVPEERVNLGNYTDGKDEQLFRKMVGLDALKCESVACLAGWLWTMPEYQDWARAAHRKIHSDEPLAAWLGINNPWTSMAFCPRMSSEPRHLGSDKSVAIARLDRLIAEAEEAR